MAAGLIVKTTTTTTSSSLVRAAKSALPHGIDIAKVRKSSGQRTSLLAISERVPAAQAEAAAAELRKRPDVVSASPNFVVQVDSTAPVTTNDSYFSILKQLWDPRWKTDPRVQTVTGTGNPFTVGGYSSKAPSVWRSTTGEGQVVAVVDTGITDHPELNDQVLPGYDFVRQLELPDGSLKDLGRDGDGVDPDPHDEGTWQAANECDEDTSARNSSWHGTHVAGIIAAEANNSLGIAGVAPGAKILPVRALGWCGGTSEEVADGIRWAAGLHVEGATDNANPADVINLSFGSYYPCSEDPVVANAISAARAAGAVVVASAGNGSVNIVLDPVTPATCPGVISVAAISEYGDRAGYRWGVYKVLYSNFGSAVDIAASGGDPFWDNRAIRSTINTGTTTPAKPTYGEYFGTSQSAAVISGAAALVRSLGTFTPDQTELALKQAGQYLPSSGKAYGFTRCACGKAIDLSKLPAPVSGVTISGHVAVGEPLTAVPGTWNASTSSFYYTWLRDGTAIPGATASTYTITQDDVGSAISVRLAPTASAFTPITATSPETENVVQGPDITLTGLPESTRYGVGATGSVTVMDGDTPVENGKVELRRGSTVLGTGVTDANGAVQIAVPGTKWVANVNNVRAAFVGTESLAAASSVGTLVTVNKAYATVAITVPRSVSSEVHAKIGVTVTVAGVPNPTGVLKVYRASRLLVTTSLSSTGGGKKTITLPLLQEGDSGIKVYYAGSSVIYPKMSTIKMMRVY